MTNEGRSQRNWTILGMSILFALAPIGFGVIRAVRTGNDFRYLWVALASLVSAAIVFVIGNVDSRRPTVAAVRATWVFVIATLFAVIAASLLGARLGPASLVVTSAFGFCYAVGCGLFILAGPQRPAAQER